MRTTLDPDWGEGRIALLYAGSYHLRVNTDAEGTTTARFEEPLKDSEGTTSAGAVERTFPAWMPLGYVSLSEVTKFAGGEARTELVYYNDKGDVTQQEFIARLGDETVKNTMIVWSDGSVDYISEYSVGGFLLKETYWFYDGGNLSEDSCEIYNNPVTGPGDPAPAPLDPPQIGFDR